MGKSEKSRNLDFLFNEILFSMHTSTELDKKMTQNCSEVIQYANLYLSIAKKEGDTATERKAYGILGISYFMSGNFQKAIEYHKKDLSLAKEEHNRTREGIASGNLGNCYYSLGNFREAIEYHENDLLIAKEVCDRMREGVANENLGNAYKSLGDYQKAKECHEKNLEIMKMEGQRNKEGMAHGNLGVIHYRLGNIQEAIERHQKRLSIAIEVSDKAGKGKSYGNLGNCYYSLGNFQKAVDYHELSLTEAKEVGDRAAERMAYANLGNAYFSLAKLQKAIECYEKELSMAKEVGDRAAEGGAYCNLGVVYSSLGNFKKVIKYQKKYLKIAKEVDDQPGEGKAYGNLGNAYYSVGDVAKAIQYHEKHLSIAVACGDRIGEGGAYCHLGNAYARLGGFQKALNYYRKDLCIAKEVGDRSGEGKAYGNLGNIYHSLADVQKAIEYHKKHLSIAKEVNDGIGEGQANCNLGIVYERLKDLERASEHFQSSVECFDFVRERLNPEDAMKISFRELHRVAYRGLWISLLKLERIEDALHAAERGRAQALVDGLKGECHLTDLPSALLSPEKVISYITSKLSSKVVFIGHQRNTINFWVISTGSRVDFRQRKVAGKSLDEDSITALLNATLEKLNLGVRVRCDSRLCRRKNDDYDDEFPFRDKCKSEDNDDDDDRVGFGGGGGGNGDDGPVESLHKSVIMNPLQPLHDSIIGPIKDLCQDDDLIIVPEGPLCLAPLSALSESIRISTVPSLTSLKLIIDSSKNCDSVKEVLLVGDPCVRDVGLPLCPLPYAKKEVEMIGEILKVRPLTGKEATKDEVLKRIKSAALVHIAGHGRKETGEIALSPNPGWRAKAALKEEDFILKMSDLQGVRLRTELVVLSSCHSGRGDLVSEGVVGIARAFLAAGARCVLVSLWAIEDEATLEFMKSFYQHLSNGRSASVSLQQAMKCLRESEKFHSARHWAPFQLIGADVTLDFEQKESRHRK